LIIGAGGNGVSVVSGTGNAVLSNSIYSNAAPSGAPGIDLWPFYLNPNDPLDADLGPNNRQNYPLLKSVVTGNGTSTYDGVLDSEPNKDFRIEFFSNTECGLSGRQAKLIWALLMSPRTRTVTRHLIKAECDARRQLHHGHRDQLRQ